MDEIDSDATLSKIFTISVYISLMDFISNKLCDKLEFPSWLSKKERSYIKSECKGLNLHSKVKRLGTQKYITIYKKEITPKVNKNDIKLSLSLNIQNCINGLLHVFPLTAKEIEIIDNKSYLTSIQRYDYLNGIPKVPKMEMFDSVGPEYRERLPIHDHLNEIYKTICASQVTMVMSDPGTGKSSQITQHIMDECCKVNKACYIVCTQSTKLAVVSTAQRVAMDRNEDVGNSIGYETKLERVCNDKTIITYCTVDVLLRDFMNRNCALGNITHILVDDVHQRIKLMDVLLVALKQNLKHYPHLRVILLAANFDHKGFSSLFDKLAVYKIESHLFHVQKYYLEDVSAIIHQDNKETLQQCPSVPKLQDIVTIVHYLHTQMPGGTILIYLSSFEDIINLKTALLHCAGMDQSTYTILTISEDIQNTDYKDAHFRLFDGFRKIILSTGFTEACLPTNDVVYIVDTGLIQCSVYGSISNSFLQHVLISKSRMEHRASRAGKMSNGKYFLLQKRDIMGSMTTNSIPEMCFAPITDICLLIKSLAPEMSILEYLSRAVQPPSVSKIQNSVKFLIAIEALDEFEQLTSIGRILLNLSVEPRLGKMIFHACVLKCLDPVLTIVSCLSYNNVFHHSSDPVTEKNLINGLKKLSSNTFSDHMALLRAFQTWSNKKTELMSDSYRRTYIINDAAMEYIINIRIKLVAELRAIELIKPRSPGDMRDLNLNSEKWYIIKAALLIGTHWNVVKIDQYEPLNLFSNVESHLNIHPFSTLLSGNERWLKKLPTQWIMFENTMDFAMSKHIECNTCITLLTLILFGGPLKLSSADNQISESDSDSDHQTDKKNNRRASLIVNDWITVYLDNHNQAQMLFDLKQKFTALVLRKSHSPFASHLLDDKIIETIAFILGEEENSAHLESPPRIGQRPHNSLIMHDRAIYEPISKKPQPFPNTNDSLYPKENTLTKKYFLIKLPSSQAVENLQMTSTWTLSNDSNQSILEAISLKHKIVFFFCIQGKMWTFYGCAEPIENISGDNSTIRINWISQNKIVNDGSVKFLKFLCQKYEKEWVKTVMELTAQCGQYFERLMTEPAMTTSIGRPIQKRTNLV